MKILADHCVFGKTVHLLQKAGHEVIRLKDIASASSEDDTVASLAVSYNAILLSNDKDFADIIKYPPKEHSGIIVLRITPQSEGIVHNTLLNLLASKPLKEIYGSLAVIRGNKIRFRR
jgi:predicted nuclease of predicted toxin-antitoxin system